MTAPPTPWGGAPLNPEVDGWHWCRARADNVRANTHEPFPVYWTAPNGHISGGWVRCIYDAEYAAAHWTYLGPVRTDAGLRAAEAASFKAGVEAAKAEVAAERADWLPLVKEGGQHPAYLHASCALVTRRLDALRVPDASALDAALERAREEERAACAKLAEQVTKAPAQRNAKDVWRENIGADIAAAIRARAAGGA